MRGFNLKYLSIALVVIALLLLGYSVLLKDKAKQEEATDNRLDQITEPPTLPPSQINQK